MLTTRIATGFVVAATLGLGGCADKGLRTLSNPSNAIKVHTEAMKPTPAPNRIPAVRPLTSVVRIAIKSAGPGLTSAASRARLNASTSSKDMGISEFLP